MICDLQAVSVQGKETSNKFMQKLSFLIDVTLTLQKLWLMRSSLVEIWLADEFIAHSSYSSMRRRHRSIASRVSVHHPCNCSCALGIAHQQKRT